MLAGFEPHAHGLVCLLRFCSVCEEDSSLPCVVIVYPFSRCSVFCCVTTPPPVYVFHCWWTFGPFPLWGTRRVIFYLLLV